MAEIVTGTPENPGNPENSDSKNPNGVAKKTNKGLIIGLSVGGGVVVIALIVILLIVLLGGISKQDWKNADEKAYNAYQTYSDNSQLINDDVSEMTSAMSDKDADLEAKISTVSDDLANFRDEMKSDLDALADEKAIKNDKTAKEKFAKANDAFKKYDATLEKLGVIYEKALPVFAKMAQIDSGEMSSLDDVKNAAAKFSEISDEMAAAKTGYEDIDDLMSTMAEDMKGSADAMNAIANGGTDLTTLNSMSSKLSSDGREFQSAFSGSEIDAQESDFIDAMSDLEDYLVSKINK